MMAGANLSSRMPQLPAGAEARCAYEVYKEDFTKSAVHL